MNAAAEPTPEAADTVPGEAAVAPRGPRCRCALILPLAGGLLIVLLLLQQTGVFRRDQIEPGTSPIFAAAPPLPAAANLADVSATEIPLIYRSVGTIQSRNRVELTPRIIARIIEIGVRDGDRVRRGDVLVRLDDSDLAAAVSQAEQRLAVAEAGVAAAVEAVHTAQAGFELAESEVGRMRQAAESRAVSRSVLDQAEAARRQAESGLAQSRRNEQGARAQAAAAEQALNEARARLAFATLASPMDGIVTGRRADPGDMASPGQVVLSLFDPSTLWLEVPVRESLYPRLETGARLWFAVQAVGQRYQGDVREIVPSVDPGSRTFMVRICIGEAAELRPGMFGMLELPIGTEPALLLPAQALHTAGQLEYVNLAAADGTLQRRLVRTVPHDDSQRRVLSGLEAGARVVLP